MKLLDKINSRCSVWSIGGFFVYLRYSRTAVLALALINQVLSSLGKPLLPIDSTQLEQLISTGFTTVSALSTGGSITALPRRSFRPMLSLSGCGRA